MQVHVDGKACDTKILFSEDQIQKRVQEVSQIINRDYSPNESLLVLVVLHGSILFAADLIRHLKMPTEIASVRLKSYHGMQSTGKVSMIGFLPDEIRNKHVLIVEDIVDSGRSMQFLFKELEPLTPKSLKLVSLLDKPEAHETPIQPDYVGFSIGKNFVIGYGLDLNGNYRNLPYIAEVLT